MKGVTGLTLKRPCPSGGQQLRSRVFSGRRGMCPTHLLLQALGVTLPPQSVCGNPSWRALKLQGLLVNVWEMLLC